MQDYLADIEDLVQKGLQVNNVSVAALQLAIAQQLRRIADVLERDQTDRFAREQKEVS